MGLRQMLPWQTNSIFIISLISLQKPSSLDITGFPALIDFSVLHQTCAAFCRCRADLRADGAVSGVAALGILYLSCSRSDISDLRNQWASAPTRPHGYSCHGEMFNAGPISGLFLCTSVLISRFEVVNGADDLDDICRGADIIQNVFHPLVGHGTLVQSGAAHRGGIDLRHLLFELGHGKTVWHPPGS